MVVKMLLSEALKVLIGDVEVNEFKRIEAFKMIAQYIADQEGNENRLTYEEHRDLKENYEALTRITFENDANYREFASSRQ